MASRATLHNGLAGEIEPLLGSVSHGDDEISSRPPQAAAPGSPRKARWWRVAPKGLGLVNVMSGIMFFAACSAGFTMLPHVRILEDILCRDYYAQHGSVGNNMGDGPIDELLCKIEPVQSQLTAIAGLKVGLEAFVSLFFALPWSLAADRIGRRPVFSLSLISMIINDMWTTTVMWFHDALPVRLILLGAASPVVGGGSAVMLGVLLSILTDATTEAERSLAFLRLHIATMCGFLLSPTLSSLMMEKTGTPWYNLIVGLALLAFGATAIFIVPETLQKKSVASLSEHDNNDTDGDNIDESVLAQVFRATRVHVTESLWIFQSRDLILLLLVCLAYMPLLNSTVQLMVPFISKRYGITIARTGYIQTAYGLMQIIQSLIVLPWLMRHTVSPAEAEAETDNTSGTASRRNNGLRSLLFLLPTYPTTQHRDLHLAILSFAVLAIGGLTLALAPTLPVFICGLGLLALGTGYTSLVRSLMSLYIRGNESHTSRLFGLTGMVETLGGVYSSPLLSVLFSVGMKLGGGGGVWIGLPWFALSGFMVVCILLLLGIRIPADQKRVCDEEEEEGEGESPFIVIGT